MRNSIQKHLMGTGLVGLTQDMMNNLQILMLEPDADKRPGPQQWKQKGLFQYCCNIVFRAGYLTLFGNLPTNGRADHAEDLLQSQKVFEEFRKIDTLFPQVFSSFRLPKDKERMKRLRYFFWDILSPQHILERDNVSAWIHSAQEQQVEKGVREKTQSNFNLLMLWISQGNIGIVSFWALLFLLKNPEALKAVREEAEGVLRKMGQEMRPGGAPITAEYSMLQQTPVLDSVMEETLRLVLTHFLLRAVKEDMILKMDSGKEYALRQGDEVSIFPYIFLHRDPEIYSDPTIFKYDHFLNSDGSRKVVFYKQRRKIRPHILQWGAGTIVCPGRFFALNEMKSFVFMMVTQYDIELVDQDVKIPSVNRKQFGTSAVQPIHDVQFQYRICF
ncbi:5-beta-cholestane-3-alpha,7-alpha-diol 12-alpha-hydroxylase-like [Sarcophilus harrisii]